MLPPSKTGLPRRPLRFSLHRSHRGGALLELAVSIPLLLLFVMGVVDYARLYYASIAVTNAAMAGAQAGQNPLNTSDSIVVQAQRDAGSVILDSVQTVRFCRCPDTGWSIARRATVARTDKRNNMTRCESVRTCRC